MPDTRSLGCWTGSSEKRFPLGQDKEQRVSEGGKKLDLASGEAVLKARKGLGQAADLSSRDGAEPARAKATKGQVSGRENAG